MSRNYRARISEQRIFMLKAFRGPALTIDLICDNTYASHGHIDNSFLLSFLQDDASQEFMAHFLIPKASSAGAKVVTAMLHCDLDGSNNIGAAICGLC